MAVSAGGGWIFTMKIGKIMKIVSRIKRIFGRRAAMFFEKKF